MKVTETDSNYNNLEHKSVGEILHDINNEDHKVPEAVGQVLNQIESLVEAVVDKLRNGGRLFYIGAGTSGRLGVLDASECPPTFGIEKDIVIGIIAGGDYALRNAVENAEDSEEQAWQDMLSKNISSRDIIVGIAASGSTPYVVNGLAMAKNNGIITGSIACNPNAIVSKYANYPIEVNLGPEYITGSTRMKSGTAQKLILNMITTATMIRLGRVKDNKMVDMQLTNIKLVDRGVQMIVNQTNLSYEQATILLQSTGSVRKALESLESK